MPFSGERFRALQRVATLALSIDVLMALIAGAAGVGAMWRGDATLAAICLIGAVVGLVLGVLGYFQLLIVRKFESSTFRLYDAILDSNEVLRQQAATIRAVADNTAMSDFARRVVHREKDHEFLRDSIHGAIIREDYQAALHLIESLDRELGYAEEARSFRAEVERARAATLEERIEAAVNRFDQLCAARKWEQARREAARLVTQFPGSERIAALPAEVDLRRQQFKRSLLREYDQAARRNDVERATQLLVELDLYLAPNEAAALKDSARGVFRAKLMQMGVQFSLAVTDKQYQGAIEIGQQIMKEFPNSRYAHEIADMLPHLRKRLTHE